MDSSLASSDLGEANRDISRSSFELPQAVHAMGELADKIKRLTRFLQSMQRYS
jgi:hypothetical protein